MSLQTGDERRRGRSRSPGRRERSRSPGPNVITAREPSYAYPEDDLDDDRYAPSSRRGDDRDRAPRGSGSALGYPEEDSMMPGGRSLYGYDDPRKSYKNSSPPPSDSYGRGSREKVEVEYRSSKVKIDDEPRVRYAEPRQERDPDDEKDKLSFLPQKYSRKYAEVDEGRHRESDRDYDSHGRDRGKGSHDDDLAYGRRHSPPKSPREESPSGYSYHKPKQYEYEAREEITKYEYAKPEEISKYSKRYSVMDVSPDRKHSARAPSPGPQYTSAGSREKKYHRDSYGGDPRSSGATILTAEPNQRRGKRDLSPQPPRARMSSLSVNTGSQSLNMSLTASNAPASPLLESYHGTYQDMSPMPSPLLLASHGDSGLVVEAISPIASDDERGDGKKKRRARFHDPEDVASRLATALKGERQPPDTETLIEVLPSLTHDQVMELRVEYKRLVKAGADRKGVNIAKHIRARLKDEDSNLMKACYSVALGRWESEAYWANFWYQGDKTRRELLIESLMGRTNEEIRQIKDGFTDKKYDNSLTKCMKTELKEDKFKKAVLLVLDERRMDEYDGYGRRIPIDSRLVEQDVEDLRHAVKSEKGGESLMISIAVSRSDSHLREVLKLYEKTYRSNFAREALKKSGNLVGELLAHILNGVINKPVRDALLLHHALTASKKDDLRRELLTSRLVRYHWDRNHMNAVKKAYRERYGKDLQEAIRESTSGRWGQFCSELCITRMPDDVKRIEKVEIIQSKKYS